MAYQLAYLRYSKRNAPGDSAAGADEKSAFKVRLKWASHLLLTSAISLWLGAIVLAAAFIELIW